LFIFLGDDTVLVRWLTDVAENAAITISKAKASDHCLVPSVFRSRQPCSSKRQKTGPLQHCHRLRMGAILHKTVVDLIGTCTENKREDEYCVFGHYPLSIFIERRRPVYFSKHRVSETGFCLRLQVKPTQLGPVDRASPYLRR
jgi:hypothetical protein